MATGRQAYFCGKPNPLMMRTGLRILNCHYGGRPYGYGVISGMESGRATVLMLSGVSTMETLRTFAYRSTMVLNGVGDIVKMAQSTK